MFIYILLGSYLLIFVGLHENVLSCHLKSYRILKKHWSQWFDTIIRSLFHCMREKENCDNLHNLRFVKRGLWKKSNLIFNWEIDDNGIWDELYHSRMNNSWLVLSQLDILQKFQAIVSIFLLVLAGDNNWSRKVHCFKKAHDRNSDRITFPQNKS